MNTHAEVRDAPATAFAVDADVIERAKTGDRRAIEAVFREGYGPAARAARALCGEADRAALVVDVVFGSALNVLPRWSAGVDPANWFTHQAVQAARRITAAGRPAAEADLLVEAAPPADRTPAYAALVRGVRRLPPQQAEAFVLHHVLRLNHRLLGVAMDCSTVAAETHLRAADAAVRPLAGPAFGDLTALLGRAAAGLTPPPAESARYARGRTADWAGRRARRRIGRFIAAALVVGLLCYLAVRFRGEPGF